MRNSKRRPLMALPLVFALAIAACGGDDDDASSETIAEDSPLAETEATDPPAAETTEAPAPEATDPPQATDPPAAETTEAPAPETTEAAPEFDLAAAVDEYASTIPEGWMSVGDLAAFKEVMEAADPVLIDVREESEYAEGFIMDAVNIPIRTLGQNLDKIPTDQQVIVYCKSGWRAGMAVSSLAMAGYDNVKAFGGGWNAWTEAEEEISTEAVEAEVFGDPGLQPEMVAAVDGFLSTIPDGYYTAGDAAAVSDAIDAGAFMLDVREPVEYAEGHIPGAENAPVRTLGSTDVDIPDDTSVIVYCKSGYRASLSVPILHVLGHDNVKGFSGSWLAWTDAGLPTETP